MGFFERLRASARARDSLLCVGLDPEAGLVGSAREAARRCIDVVGQTADLACAYKPNIAFWEQFGGAGWEALEQVREAIPQDIPVIVDAKRADVPSTMQAYARALFDELRADAVTLHAYHGRDSLRVFTERADRGVYVVCRTSDPGASDLQHLDLASGEPLYLRVARLAQEVSEHGNVGLVVGATAPAEVGEVRARFPQMPMLLPGVGAQGGDLAATTSAAWNGDPAACLLPVSRSILQASEPRQAALQLRDRIRSLLPALS